MIGAIAGDIIGSVYERIENKTKNFPLFNQFSRFTDDSVLTIATMLAFLEKIPYPDAYRKLGRKYPSAGYGGNFYSWLMYDNFKAYNSWGNGSAMRVSPVGWCCNSLEVVLYEAKKSSECSHNHPEGIKGAQAIASCIFLAREQNDKEDIKKYVERHFNYDLDRKLDEIRPLYKFDVSSMGSVPEAIIAFLESNDYEDAVRNAVSIGGDSDTIACMAGGIAEAFYKEVPAYIKDETLRRLTPDLREIVERFYEQYKN